MFIYDKIVYTNFESLCIRSDHSDCTIESYIYNNTWINEDDSQETTPSGRVEKYVP